MTQQNIDYDLAKMIDHTLLRPDASYDELQKVCDEAKAYSFASVCVNSANIPFVASQLQNSTVKPIAVVGFPLGAAVTSAKVFEAQEAIRQGAQEIDMVINIGALKSKDYRLVYEDIRAVVEASAPQIVKVILETGGLSEEEKIIACALSKAARAAFVKTSTGFGKGGATVEDVTLMKRIVGPEVEVKASGGVRTREDALKMIQAGATRLGASSSVAIVTGKKGDSAY
jgi:deoxyribose-phosphate aldolase